MPETVSAPAVLHASCVRWHERGVLVEGPPGAGKSDLVLRLLDAGALLVGDDLVRIERRGGRLIAAAVDLAGRLEVRGQGIFAMAGIAATGLDLWVRLVDAPGERLPEPAWHAVDGVALPVVELDPRLASAVARIRIALLGSRVA
jgi:serine kinase of HPr protein (carbohydrate metabolism regulator)